MEKILLFITLFASLDCVTAWTEGETEMQSDTYELIIILSLIIAALSLIVACIMYVRFRFVMREKNRCLARILQDRDRTERKLEHLRIEKETIEKAFQSSLSKNTESSELKDDKPIK